MPMLSLYAGALPGLTSLLSSEDILLVYWSLWAIGHAVRHPSNAEELLKQPHAMDTFVRLLGSSEREPSPQHRSLAACAAWALEHLGENISDQSRAMLDLYSPRLKEVLLHLSQQGCECTGVDSECNNEECTRACAQSAYRQLSSPWSARAELSSLATEKAAKEKAAEERKRAEEVERKRAEEVEQKREEEAERKRLEEVATAACKQADEEQKQKHEGESRRQQEQDDEVFARRCQAELDAADDQDVEVIQLDRATHDGPHSTAIEEPRTSDHCATTLSSDQCTEESLSSPVLSPLRRRSKRKASPPSRSDESGRVFDFDAHEQDDALVCASSAIASAAEDCTPRKLEEPSAESPLLHAVGYRVGTIICTPKGSTGELVRQDSLEQNRWTVQWTDGRETPEFVCGRGRLTHTIVAATDESNDRVGDAGAPHCHDSRTKKRLVSGAAETAAAQDEASAVDGEEVALTADYTRCKVACVACGLCGADKYFKVVDDSYLCETCHSNQHLIVGPHGRSLRQEMEGLRASVEHLSKQDQQARSGLRANARRLPSESGSCSDDRVAAGVGNVHSTAIEESRVCAEEELSMCEEAPGGGCSDPLPSSSLEEVGSHNYVGHTYIINYTGHEYMYREYHIYVQGLYGHNYTGHEYIGHSRSHYYIGHNYIGP